MNDPRMITPNKIITERHKAWDIVKMGKWHKTKELRYKGIIYWELLKEG